MKWYPGDILTFDSNGVKILIKDTTGDRWIGEVIDTGDRSKGSVWELHQEPWSLCEEWIEKYNGRKITKSVEFNNLYDKLNGM